MIPSIRRSRAPLSWALMVAAAAPLAVVGHVHAADHDEGVRHVEAPHGDHEFTVLEFDDRLPTNPPDRLTDAPARVDGHAAAPEPGTVVWRETRAAGPPPARPPPRTRRARAPPRSLL